jgi:hypothetical protein
MVSRNFLRIAQLGLMAAAVLSLAAPLAAETQEEQIARLQRMMTDDGFAYRTTKSPTVFTIHLTGTHIQDIKVVLAIGGDADSDLIVFVTVTEKRRMPVTTDFMRTLLEENHKLDQVKVAYDNDGDLEVRVDASMRLTDAAYLKNIVNQVKTSSDEIYGTIAPSLLP